VLPAWRRGCRSRPVLRGWLFGGCGRGLCLAIRRALAEPSGLVGSRLGHCVRLRRCIPWTAGRCGRLGSGPGVGSRSRSLGWESRRPRPRLRGLLRLRHRGRLYLRWSRRLGGRWPHRWCCGGGGCLGRCRGARRTSAGPRLAGLGRRRLRCGRGDGLSSWRGTTRRPSLRGAGLTEPGWRHGAARSSRRWGCGGRGWALRLRRRGLRLGDLGSGPALLGRGKDLRFGPWKWRRGGRHAPGRGLLATQSLGEPA
jgi:hypothetical protein